MKARFSLWTPAAILVIAGTAHSLAGGPGPYGATLELSSLDGTNGFVLNGINAGDQSGISVSGAGDVNGDGIDDIIIGARNAGNNDYSSIGECYVVFGGTVSQTWAGSKLDLATITTSQLQGEFCLIINGTTKGDRVGDSVSTAGDVNGDGIDDIIIGARFRSPNGGYSGESFVVFGKAPAPDAIPGDINGDGIVDTADLGILIGNFGTMGP